MNINNLTIKAQEVLQSAMNLARSDRNQAVEPLHMLDAIVAEDDSVGVFLLQKLGDQGFFVGILIILPRVTGVVGVGVGQSIQLLVGGNRSGEGGVANIS
mgnify:CR=1 FL=1